MTSLPPLERALSELPPFEGRHFGSGADFRAWLERAAADHGHRRAREVSLSESSESFHVDGWCALCGRRTRFWVDRAYGYPVPGMRWLMPNWRERLACEHCQLNNRMRAALHYLLAFGQPLPWEPLYITEQSTPLFTALRTLVPGAMGSEFLGPSTPTGTIDARGLRNESLTRLTFEDARFRFLLTFDVLEHVPDTAAALGECARVLQPGGWLILTAPFDVHRESTLRRASLHPDGGVVHHVEPEYHGDPLNPEGILSYFTFGWDLLEGLASHGFERPRAFVYWSEELGYLGESQVIVSARRAPR